MINKELRDKWITALRSGSYKQGEDLLKSVDDNENIRYCCLGVLCEVADIKSEIDEEQNFFTFDGMEDLLTKRLLSKFGLTSEEQDFLASMNDGTKGIYDGCVFDFTKDKKDFHQIANWIEQNL